MAAKDLIDLFILGEALVDFVPLHRGHLSHNTAFEIYSGGAPCNVAIGAARFGAKVAYSTVLGDDPFGQFLIDALKVEGVNIDGVRVTDEDETGLCFVTLDKNGERSFLHRGGHSSILLTKDDLPLHLVRKSQAMLFTIGSLRNEQGEEAVRTAISTCPGVILCDPGICPGNWGHTTVVQKRLHQTLPLCNVVKCSSDECQFVTGESNPEDAANKLLSLGVELAVITLGPDGALWKRQHDSGHVPSPDVTVVDTTGAGDAFMAALCVSLSKKGHPQDLSREAISQSIAEGCAAGALAVTHRGAVTRHSSIL